MAVTVQLKRHVGDSRAGIRGGTKVKFQVGDKVREGTRLGTVTDVGTMLIQVRTNLGTTRVVCPWDLVPIRASHEEFRSSLAAR